MKKILSPGPQPGTLLDEQGKTWQVSEDVLLGSGGENANQLSGHLAYWFGWFEFFPNILINK